MVKLLMIIFFALANYALAAEASKTPKYPTKIEQYKTENFLSVEIDEPEFHPETPVSALDFDLNFTRRLDAFKFMLNGIVEFNRRKYCAAFTYFVRASENGSIEALYFMGSMQMSGLGVVKDKQLAENKLQMAMDRGCKAAAFDLGQYYLFKAQPDVERAKNCFQKFPQDKEFKFYLGLTLLGSGFDEDMKKIHEASNLGSKIAEDYLASSSRDSFELERKSFGSYIELKNVDRFDSLLKGLRAYQAGNHQNAFDLIYLGALASRHSAEYHYLLANMYFSDNDARSGKEFLTYSADQGYQPARFDLGLRYYLAKDVEKNDELALAYLDKSLEPRFQFHCGLVLKDSPSDLNKRRGFLLIKHAAEKGYPFALYALKDSFVIVNDEWGSYLKSKSLQE